MDSYSEYAEEVKDWYHQNVDPEWAALRDEIRSIMAEDDMVQQTIRLMGEDVLPDSQRLIALTASFLKAGYLQQNSFSADSFCPPMKGVTIMKLILDFYNQARKLIAEGCPLSLIRKMKELIELSHVRELSADDKAGFGSLGNRIRERLEIIGKERLAREQEEEGI